MDDMQKILARIAGLESELSGYRSNKQTQAPAFDGAAMTRDPMGFMRQHGLNHEHITRVLIANQMQQMGIPVPPHLQAIADMGPTVSATHALQTQVEQISRQVSEMVNGGQKARSVESFKALAQDKVKYPALAKAFAADPSLFEDELSAGGNAEELATKLNTREAKRFAAYGVKVEPTQPASDANADENAAHSTQGKPAAVAANLNGEMPPITHGDKAGLFTPEEHTKLRDEIVRKFTPKT